jgi:hypothetical protein
MEPDVCQPSSYVRVSSSHTIIQTNAWSCLIVKNVCLDIVHKIYVARSTRCMSTTKNRRQNAITLNQVIIEVYSNRLYTDCRYDMSELTFYREVEWVYALLSAPCSSLYDNSQMVYLETQIQVCNDK